MRLLRVNEMTPLWWVSCKLRYFEIFSEVFVHYFDDFQKLLFVGFYYFQNEKNH